MTAEILDFRTRKPLPTPVVILAIEDDCSLSSAKRRIEGRRCRHILGDAAITGKATQVSRISGVVMAMWRGVWTEARLLVPSV